MGRVAKRLKPPTWFDEVATDEFKRVEKILREEEVDFTQKDIRCLEAYSMNYSKWVNSEKVLLEKGFTIAVNDEGYEQQRPEVSIAAKAQQEMRAWAKELALTPSARARIGKGAKIDDDTDPEMERMISK